MFSDDDLLFNEGYEKLILEEFERHPEAEAIKFNIFFMEMLKKKIRLYRSPVDIAGIDQSESSWFRGFDERYFITTGKVLHTIFSRLALLLAVRSAFRFSRRKNCQMSFFKILKCYLRGMREKQDPDWCPSTFS